MVMAMMVRRGGVERKHAARQAMTYVQGGIAMAEQEQDDSSGQAMAGGLIVELPEELEPGQYPDLQARAERDRALIVVAQDGYAASEEIRTAKEEGRTIKPGVLAALQKRIAVGNRAKTELLNCYKYYWQRCAKYWSYRYRWKVDEEDMLQEVWIAAVTAIDKFDLSEKGGLLTYATWWIRSRVSRLVDSAAIIRVPSDENNPAYQKDRERARALRSLDASVGKGERTSTAAQLLEDDETIDSRLDGTDIRDMIETALEYLDEDQRHFIQLRFVDEMSLRDIGEMWGITCEGVRKIEIKVLKRLRNAMVDEFPSHVEMEWPEVLKQREPSLFD